MIFGIQVEVEPIALFLPHLKGFEVSIHFTVEVKSKGEMPYLNVPFNHEADISISMNVYKNPTHTKQYLDFGSHHPIAHKRSVNSTLLSKADRISPTVTSKKSKEEHVASD